MKKLILTISSVLTLNISSGFAQVSYDELLELDKALQSAFSELSPNTGESLVVNQEVPGRPQFWWSLDTVYASYSLGEVDGNVSHNIFLFGGFARLPGMTLDGLALTACHEIGHGIGGPPYKESGSSAEGQSDYYSTKTCLPVVFKFLRDKEHRSLDPVAISRCNRSSMDIDLCLRLFRALETDIVFFRYLGAETTFSERAKEVATELNFSASFYPSPQCRIDTMSNGILGMKRPVCWYPNSNLSR